MKEDAILIRGGRELRGTATVHGAKNAVLPMLAAALLTDETVTVCDCPYITDVDAMERLLAELGAQVERDGRRISVGGSVRNVCADARLYKTMRSSMFMLGALLAVTGEARLPLPGGCAIGARPLDIHINGLQLMGAKIKSVGDTLECRAEKLHGADIVMKYPSVGATENLLMCAALAEGTTRLINCAREPEIVSLAEALRAMGARISGDGSSVMRIDGVDRLYGACIKPCGDRIVAGTILIAVALCGGDVRVYGTDAEYLRSVIGALSAKGCTVKNEGAYLHVISDGYVGARSVVSAPFPLFPTDLQPQMCALLCFSDGVSQVTETVFESRFAHLNELAKLGATSYVMGNTAYICGRRDLKGADMTARDLRGGAGLCIAALKAEGESMIGMPHFIDRGYEGLCDCFASLGADIKRIGTLR